MIFETHAHYDDESFNDDREALIRMRIIQMRGLMKIERNYWRG